MDVGGHPVQEVKLPKLEGFERLVYGRQYEQATDELLQSLIALRHGVPFSGRQKNDTALYTRFASAVTALFCDPNFKLSMQGFNRLSAEQETLNAVFECSHYGSADHVWQMLDPDQGGLGKYLLLWSMNSRLAFDYEAALRSDPENMLGFYLAMLGRAQVLSEHEDRIRQRMIELAPMFDGVKMHEGLFHGFLTAYMHVSYAHGPDKHAPKKMLHRMLADMIGPVPIVAPPTRRRPVILIPLEWWWEKHAMYRCYSQVVMQLKEDFHLVGMGRDANTSATARAAFDEWVSVPENVVFRDVIADVRKVAPDIIYYPSVGMSIWTVVMASLRLAPIQVMSYGHPATTHSPAMDYGILEADGVDQECYSEKIITLPNNSIRFSPNSKTEVRHQPKKPETLKIVIPAMHCKTGWPFIRALQEIERRAGRPVEFHFIPYLNGLMLERFAKQVAGLLKSTMVYERAPYEEYMGWIADCDIALFSFPFGGTNSVIDAALVGMPMVVMEGREAHEKSDAALIRRLGLPESMIVRDEAAYVDAVLKLMDDDDRAEVAGKVAQVSVEETFFEPDDGKAFLGAFRNLWADRLKAAA
jgi:hypothetical protein